MARVKMTLLRRSGTLKMLASRESMADLRQSRPGVGHYRFIKALPDAGGRPWPKGRGTRSTLPPATMMAASADAEKAWAETRIGRDNDALAQHLDQRLRPAQPGVDHRLRR